MILQVIETTEIQFPLQHPRANYFPLPHMEASIAVFAILKSQLIFDTSNSLGCWK